MILRVSQGFPPPSKKARFKIVVPGKKKILLPPPPVGHPLDHLHLKGHELAALLNDKASGIKTAFLKKHDMYQAFADALNSPEGMARLDYACAHPGKRVELLSEIDPVPIQVAFGADISGGGYARFNKHSLATGGVHKLRTVSVIEMRERNGMLYPHCQTMYPKLEPAKLELVLQALQAHEHEEEYEASVGEYDLGEYDEEQLTTGEDSSEEKAPK